MSDWMNWLMWITDPRHENRLQVIGT